MSLKTTQPAPAILTAPVVIHLHHPDMVAALNRYRQVQHKMYYLDSKTAPQDQVNAALAEYEQAATNLANHISVAVRIERGETL